MQLTRMHHFVSTELKGKTLPGLTRNFSMPSEKEIFCSKEHSKLKSKFPASDTSKIYVKSENKTFNFKLFTAIQVKKVLDSLNSKKSSGIDGINVRLLKEGSTVLVNKLLRIFNISISTGCVPRPWKIKRVSHIFKSGPREDSGNYQPVSHQPLWRFFKSLSTNSSSPLFLRMILSIITNLALDIATPLHLLLFMLRNTLSTV